MNGTRGIVAVLTCLACAATAAAQAPEDGRARLRELRQQVEASKAQTQADAKVAAAQRRGGAARGQRGGQAEASETFVREVRLERGGTFDLQSGAGNVSISGGGGRDARIEVFKRVRAFSDGRAQIMLPQLKVEIAERGGNVEVRSMGPRGAGQARVDYVVTLPADINVILRSTTGNLRVQNMSGDELSANTLSGDVTVRDSRSRMLELHTVQGNMRLQDIAAQRALLESTIGNLEFVGQLLRAGRYQFQTHRGDIHITPSGSPGFDLEAMTFSGDLRSDFVLRLPQPAPVPGRRLQKILRGKVGDAGAMLTASTFSGNIVIVRPEGAQ